MTDSTRVWFRYEGGGTRIYCRLLQHKAGTLDLRVEVMLASHVLEIYNSVHEINWIEVVSKPEFTGHTVYSLKNHIFNSKTKR